MIQGVDGSQMPRETTVFAPGEPFTEIAAEAPLPYAVWSAELQKTSEIAAEARLEALGRHVPEAVAQATTITEGAALLIEAFRVTPDFFAEPDRSTVFLSLSLQAAKLQKAAGQLPEAETERQQEFLTNAAFLLTRQHSLADSERLAEYETQYPAAQSSRYTELQARVCRDFEQPEVTRSLARYIEVTNLTGSIEKRLHPHGQAASPFNPHVLGIGILDFEDLFAADANTLTDEEIAAWHTGLAQRTHEFAARLPDGDVYMDAEGFTDLAGNAYLTLPVAEALLASKHGIALGRGAMRMDPPALTLRHEYVHTQDPIAFDDMFGRMLEECRAKYFSGDHLSYLQDMRAFNMLDQFYPVSLRDMFDQVAASRNTEAAVSIYELIGRHYGLESVAELAALHPRCNSDALSISPEVAAMLKALDNNNAEAIVERILQRSGSDSQRIDKAMRSFSGVGLLGLHRWLQNYTS